MEHQRETEIVEPATSTHTTIIREKRGSGGVMIALIVIVGLLVAGFLYMRSQDSQMMRDAAIADAAQQVGDSAEKAGSAVENAAKDLTGE